MERATFYYVVFLAWSLFSLTKPAILSLDFSLLFTSSFVMMTVFCLQPLSFASGLHSVLRSARPPTIAWFKTTRLRAEKLWAVYVLVLEKQGCRPKIYIGSGTDKVLGVARRLRHYDKRMLHGTGDLMPKWVEAALKAGYTITHKGLLVWTPLPPAALRQALHSMMLLLEAVFTYFFWAMVSKKGYGMPKISLWPVDSFTYDGACGHFSINEGFSYDPALTNFTAEQINQMDLARKKAKNRMYIANKGPGVHAANSKATRDAALDAQRYKCDPCVLTFPNDAKLKAHLGSKRHADKIAGKGRTTNGRGGGQRAIEARRF